MKDATYAPTYCAMYPKLAEIGRKHGYAMAVHGTLAKDMDLTCIPWTEAPSEPKDVVREITKTFHIRTIGEPNTTHHGRERWTVSVGFGECFIDLSFMPRISVRQREPSVHVAWCRYVMKHGLATRIVLCDSDAEGAFPVFRGPTSAMT